MLHETVSKESYIDRAKVTDTALYIVSFKIRYSRIQFLFASVLFDVHVGSVSTQIFLVDNNWQVTLDTKNNKF